MYNPNAKRRRIKPYARPTSFDYNVRFDIRQYQDVKYNRIRKPFFQAASQDEVFRVMEGELLVKSNMANARYNDKELHVFSFANGLAAPANAPIGGANPDFTETTTNSMDEQKRTRMAILETIQYMGVAVTEFHPGRDVYEQGMVATIAGLNTLYNNGAETIYPGQTVCLDLPVLREAGGGAHYKRALQMGIPREKLQFILRPHQDMVDDYDGNIPLVNRFIVGTAISYSRPGDTVDVILHRMNYTSTSVNGNLGGLGAVGDHDPRDLLLGKFLARTVSDDELEHAYQGIMEFEEVVMRISNTQLREAIDDARGEGNTGDTITRLMARGNPMDLYDKEQRLELLERHGAEIAATAGVKKVDADPGLRAGQIQAIRAAIAADPTKALVGDNDTIMYKDIATYIDALQATGNLPSLEVDSPIQQIITLGSVAAVFSNLEDLAKEVTAQFNKDGAGNEGNSLFRDRNAPTNPGVGPKTYDDGHKAPQTVVAANTLSNRALSLSTSVPKISAAVGSLKTKKKK